MVPLIITLLQWEFVVTTMVFFSVRKITRAKLIIFNQLMHNYI